MSRKVVSSWLAVSTVLGCVGEPGSQQATIRFGLSAEQCADLCANAIGAEVYRDGDPLPLGPPVLTTCGEAVIFEALPAGHRVFVRAWVARDGQVLVSGDSDVITVVADETLDVTVPTLAVSAPIVDSVAPDPVLVAEAPVALTIDGSGFGAGEGAFGVTLSGEPLSVASWSSERIDASISAGVVGDTLRVMDCGLGSESLPVRVLAATAPGLETIAQAPGCSGRAFTGFAARADQGDIVVAATCDDPAQGYVQRLGGDACLTLGESTVIGANPSAVAAAPGDSGVWIAVDDHVKHLVFGGAIDVDVALPDGLAAIAMTAADGGVYAIGRGSDGATTLYEVSGGSAVAVPNLTDGLEFAQLVTGTAHVLATAVDGGGATKLVGIPRAAGVVTEWSLAGCETPTGLAASDTGWVAVVCDDGAESTLVAGFRPDDSSFVSTPIAGEAADASVAFDALGEVVLVLSGGGTVLTAVQFDGSDATPLVSWPVSGASASPLVRFGAGHHFLVGGPDSGALTIVAPYALGFACGG